jgi:hypothetical protein
MLIKYNNIVNRYPFRRNPLKMTRKITLAVAALLCSGVLAQYTKAPIEFQTTLDCTSCIRGGYNYCVTIGGDKNNTIVS